MNRVLTPARRLGGLLAAALAAAGVLVGPAGTAHAAALPNPDHVVIVMMENEDYSSIIGNTAQAPYINSLAQQGASFSDSHGVYHPSLPNYEALLSGSTQGLTDSTPPPVGSINADNLPNELIQHGLGFADYSDEATPAAWLRFADLPGTATAPNPVDKWLSCPSPTPGQGCGFPAGAAGYSALPAVTFVHGNANQSMHDGNILEGDTWVKNTVGGYASWARTHNSLLIVTWDEDDFTAANHMPTVFYGANVKPGSYSETINHYNVLRTVEDMYGLPELANSATATPITDVWGSTTFGTGSGPGVVSGYSNRCLDDSGSSTTNLNPIVLWSCTGNPNQSWTLPGNGTVQVFGKCMDVLHSGTADSTPVELYTCNGGGAQQWAAQADGSLVNPESGKCLDDPGSSLSGAQLIIWDCNGGANQKWALP
ncbi:alkaline phosphatase family protein [Kitasatospora sp. NBC_01266]|uniref:alkaline phosphatase family protein n=1 Tax=Kitasatospora sp. NBC_01266 TaxID=2903572 RepID=UPI002E35B2B4|nr:alkaline phosphatase family protein [Kitasatospora sp. NBC_01266]